MTEHDPSDILGAVGWSTRDMAQYSEEELQRFADEEIEADNKENESIQGRRTDDFYND